MRSRRNLPVRSCGASVACHTIVSILAAMKIASMQGLVTFRGSPRSPVGNSEQHIGMTWTFERTPTRQIFPPQLRARRAPDRSLLARAGKPRLEQFDRLRPITNPNTTKLSRCSATKVIFRWRYFVDCERISPARRTIDFDRVGRHPPSLGAPELHTMRSR